MSKEPKSKDEEFPYDTLPWKLVVKEADGIRKCFFQTEEHRTKHIERYKLNKKDIQLSYKYDI
jgi:hypothetical protein